MTANERRSTSSRPQHAYATQAFAMGSHRYAFAPVPVRDTVVAKTRKVR